MIETGTGLITGLRGKAWDHTQDPDTLNGAGSDHEEWHAVYECIDG